MRLVRVVGRAVEELAGELVPRQPPVADELAQGVLGADTEEVVELVDEVSGLGVVDERLGGCEAGLIARELLLRRKAKTIVVAAPPSVLEQWKGELEDNRSSRWDASSGLPPCRHRRSSLIPGPSLRCSMPTKRITSGRGLTDLDEAPPKNRTAARFLGDLDQYAGRIVSMAEQDGSDIGDAMRVLRQNLATALRQAKRASNQSTGGPH